MPQRLPLALVLGALALAGCDSDDELGDPTPPPAPTQPEPKPPESEQDVVLTLDRDSPHPGETLELTVENHTDTRLEYGLMYRLERRVDSGWRWINRDAAFALILKVVEPGKREREDIGLAEDLRSGRYRIVKSFTAPATGRKYRATVEFTVANA